MRYHPLLLALLAVSLATASWSSLLAQSGSEADYHSHPHSPGTEVGKPFTETLPGVPGKIVRITPITFKPDGIVDGHCHNGPEYGIVTEGTLTVTIGNDKPQTKSKGEVFSVPARTPMFVKNETKGRAQLYSTLIVDEKPPYVIYLDEPNDCMKN
jgi:quercetin dioxygenase-like cupin family protein